ncbi:MAG: InlB B-repeat-containing protein [Oscillospiraceae bacterium]|nr:InlB B-repeat-containing protein [Oscillospiraceae bacterium]
MYRKAVSLLLVLLMTALIAFPVSAENVTFSINVTDCSVEVKQNGVTIYSGSSSGSFTADSANGTVTVNITSSIPSESGLYPDIDGNVSISKSYEPNQDQTISVAVRSIPTPTVTLSANTSTGGLSYSIKSNSNLPVTRFELQVFDSGNNTAAVISPAESSGSIAIGGGIVAGKNYTASARQCIANTYYSQYGSKSGDATAVAVYSLTTKVSSDGGTVGNFAGNYVEGKQISISASPKSGYKFAGWESSGGGSFEDSKAASTTFTMPAKDTVLTALFKKTFKFVIKSSTGGKVWDVDGDYYEGEEVKVSAIPGTGYLFDSWVSSDGGKFTDSKAVSTIFFMPANDTTVTATFKEDPGSSSNPDTDTDDTDNPGFPEGMFEVKTRTTEGGNIVINQNRAQEGQKITVRATAMAGFVFDGWSSEGGGSFADDKAASTTFTMPAGDVVIIASFVAGDGASSAGNGGDVSGENENKSGSRGGIIWFILAVVGVLIAAAAGALLIVNERKKRREQNYGDVFSAGQSDDGFSAGQFGDDFATGQFSEDFSAGQFDDATPYDEAGAQNAFEADNSSQEKFKWRNTRRPKNRRPDNKFHADDWDD